MKGQSLALWYVGLVAENTCTLDVETERSNKHRTKRSIMFSRKRR